MHLSLILIILQQFFYNVNNIVIPETVLNIDLTRVTNYEIIKPEFLYKIERRRKNLSYSVYYEYNDEIELLKLGDWIVDLNSNNNLVIRPNLQVQWISDIKTSVAQVTRCEYKSGVITTNVENSSVILTFCGTDINGYLNINGESYFIEPFNKTSKQHVLYQSYSSTNREKRSTNLNNTSLIKQWEYFNLTGDVIDIGVEKNSNDENGEEDVKYSKTNSTFLKPRKLYREQYDSDEIGYFYDSAWETNTYSGNSFKDFYNAFKKIPFSFIMISLPIKCVQTL